MSTLVRMAALILGIFCVSTAELSPSGMLGEFSRDLSVTIPASRSGGPRGVGKVVASGSACSCGFRLPSSAPGQLMFCSCYGVAVVSWDWSARPVRYSWISRGRSSSPRSVIR